MPFNPESLLASIGEEKILLRYHSLKTICIQLVLPECPGTFLQDFILRNTVESYFCDLQHSKNFHDISLADRHKVSAFAVKWIIKSRPVQLNASSNPGRKHILLANEIFALTAGLIYLGADIRKVSNSLFRSLLYTLHHRSFDAESMAAMMCTIECALNNEKP